MVNRLNRGLRSGPSDYTIGSGCKVWWRCRTNPMHFWEASPSNRYYGETGAGVRLHACIEGELDRPEFHGHSRAV
ncbi:zinc-ribbon domain-containing protein [Burkholderia sp. lyk4-R2A-23]|uniref:zinc-ribbon domain-containing protein n=1 Tax=Burkholderia sp. lyk4-R2A-23 TaxID=3040284 RepID=UPI003305C9F1